MNEEEKIGIRFECLKLAVQMITDSMSDVEYDPPLSDYAISAAKDFYAFVTDERKMQ
jgi:hypothetical protein